MFKIKINFFSLFETILDKLFTKCNRNIEGEVLYHLYQVYTSTFRTRLQTVISALLGIFTLTVQIMFIIDLTFFSNFKTLFPYLPMILVWAYISDNLRLVSLDEIIGLAVDPHMKNKLEECNKNLKESKKLLNDLITNCKRLNTSGVEQLIENAKEANRTLNDAVINSLPNITNTFKLNVGDVIDSYKDRIVQKTKNNIGHCKPVSLVINATLASTCDGVFIPLNGLWFTMFWALLLFIPTIFIATSLASIFKAYNNGSNRHMNNSWNMSFLKRKNKKNKQTTEPNYDLYYNSTPSNRYGDMAPNFGDGAAHNRRNKNKKNKQTPEPDYDLYYNSTPSNRFGASAPKYNEGETRF